MNNVNFGMDIFMELLCDPNIIIIDFLSITKGKLRISFTTPAIVKDIH